MDASSARSLFRRWLFPARLPTQDEITQCRPFGKIGQKAIFRERDLHDGVSMPASVTVTVPARLHLGFLDLNGGLGRRFGSIGLAISDLRTRITIRRATRSEVSGPESDRVRQYLQTMERCAGAGRQPRGGHCGSRSRPCRPRFRHAARACGRRRLAPTAQPAARCRGRRAQSGARNALGHRHRTFFSRRIGRRRRSRSNRPGRRRSSAICRFRTAGVFLLFSTRNIAACMASTK